MVVDERPHNLAGCRRRDGKDCYEGCPCHCHVSPAHRTPDWHTPAWVRGIERARAELAKLPPDDGLVTVSTPDRAKVEREHFKLCRACSQTPERCRC